jgi:transposase
VVEVDYTQMGYSQREIAEKLGVSRRTVEREVAQNAPPDSLPDQIQGRDGKSYPRERRQPEPDVPQPNARSTVL